MIWILYMCFADAPRRRKLLDGVYRQVCQAVKRGTPETAIRHNAPTSKKELLACIAELRRTGALITEWHVVGSGTSYGPLLGSPDWPEQLSAYEWSRLSLPFVENARVWFYAEDSGLWLAPFMATAFQVTTYGCRRLTGRGLPEMHPFPPGVWNQAAGYDPVAPLYAEAFSDISVRRDECRWLEERLQSFKPEQVLDVGCGNGALLARLAPHIARGFGVDISSETVGIAVRSNRRLENLAFSVISGPALPFADHSFNAVVSMLSFRYLDWDPILEEMKRVLAPGGHILIVDMVASSPRPFELPRLLRDKLDNALYLKKRQSYKKALRALVSHPDWRRMIGRHPMRGAKEFAWYLKSRFPGGTLRVLNTGVRAKIVSFDSGPIG